jgi:hypothetical protein
LRGFCAASLVLVSLTVSWTPKMRQVAKVEPCP